MKNNKTMRRKQVAMVVRPQKGTASPEGRRNMAEGCLSRHCREFSNPCKIYETTKNTGKTQKRNPHQKSTTVTPTEFKGKNIFYFMYQKDSSQARPADHSCLPLCVEGSYKPWKKSRTSRGELESGEKDAGWTSHCRAPPPRAGLMLEDSQYNRQNRQLTSFWALEGGDQEEAPSNNKTSGDMETLWGKGALLSIQPETPFPKVRATWTKEHNKQGLTKSTWQRRYSPSPLVMKFLSPYSWGFQ